MAKLINTLISRQTLAIYKRSPFFQIYANRLNVLIDSGAFIEFRKKTRMWTPEEYHNWLDDTLDMFDRYNVRVDGYMTLDVVKDRIGTRENYEKSLAAGYKPIPILTQGFDEDDFKLYTSTSKRIAVGSIAAMDNEAIQHLYRAMEMLKHYNLDVHLLGVDKHQLIHKYRPGSVDSTVWSYLTRSGRALYMRNLNTLEPRIPKTRLSAELDLSPSLRMQLRKSGFDPKLVAKQRRWVKDQQGFLFQCFMLADNRRYAELIEQTFGTRYFFALITNRMMNMQLMHTGHMVGDPLPCLGMGPGHKDAEKWMKQYKAPSGDYIIPPKSHLCHHT